MVNLSLDRNSSDDSLNSGSNRSSFSSGVGNNITLPSPGSSSSPRSPISPSWNNDVSEVISRSSNGEGTNIELYLLNIYDSFLRQLTIRKVIILVTIDLILKLKTIFFKLQKKC